MIKAIALPVALVVVALTAAAAEELARHWRFSVLLDEVWRGGWDRSFLTESRLLNSQTGEYQEVNLTQHGVESIRVSGHPVEAQHDSLGAAHLGIDLWYSSDGDWLALESKLESGRTLRYEIQ